MLGSTLRAAHSAGTAVPGDLKILTGGAAGPTVAEASANVTLPLLEVTLHWDTVVRTETALTWLAKLSLLCDGRPASMTRKHQLTRLEPSICCRFARPEAARLH